jgi:hypothetical protein
MFEDELKEANECNSILAAWLLEVKTKLAEESRLKDSKFLLPLFLVIQIISGYTLD